MGNRIIEAFEVTANEWQMKLAFAWKIIRDNDLSRLHVVAKIPDVSAALKSMDKLEEDISILDIQSYTASLIATLTRSGRALALRRLYEFLDRYQSDVEVVNTYVHKLAEFHLTEA